MAAPASDEDKIVAELFGLLEKSFDERADSVPANLQFLKQGKANVECEQIGTDEGYMNYVYRLAKGEGETSQSVVVKWSRLTPRFSDAENVELSKEERDDISQLEKVTRNTRECKAVRTISSILPGSTAQIFWLDEDRHFFIMEDLKHHATWRSLLDKGHIVTDVFQAIANKVGNLHRRTHIKTMQPGTARTNLYQQFTHPDVMKDIGMVLFDLLFKSDSGLAMLTKNRKFSAALEPILPEIFDNQEIRDVLATLKKVFVEDVECVLHNDTHPGSFMVNPDVANGDVRMIDLEFSCMSNPSKDVGYTMGEMVMFYYVHQGRGYVDASQKVQDGARAFITSYMEVMGELISEQQRFLQLVSAFCGHFAGFRLVGQAIDFKQFEGLEEAEARCLLAAIRLMKEMDTVSSVEDMMELAFRPTALST